MPKIECFTVKNKRIGEITVPATATVKDVKVEISKINPALPVGRQSLRPDIKGKDLQDEKPVSSLGLKVYVKDLGPQISWRFVFLSEYLGPLVVYLMFYFYFQQEMQSFIPHLAAACWTLHYAKRLLETIFVHRFSHSTMPIANLFKNCGYYWGFAAYVAYHVNHPYYTAPHFLLVVFGLAIFAVSELGNLSIHLLLRDLRPPGTKVRKIPEPNSNPLTLLFNYVSCPNYTYEYTAWLGFSIMTLCLPALIFAAAGGYQMAIWALGKHKNYKKEFSNYPKQRKAIFPFIL